MTLREWCSEVERLCLLRLKKSIVNISGITVQDMEEAWSDGVTPEEYYTCDVVCEVSYEEPFGGASEKLQTKA